MNTPKERQLHMVKLIKALDRLIAERHGKSGVPIIHFQKPHGAPGERESVCVYVDRERREYLPYGVELEKQVEKARLWVREGGGVAPEVVKEGRNGFSLVRPKASDTVLTLVEAEPVGAQPKAIDPK